MIEYLELDNVGPAPRMKIEFAPRVNLITGDNGLGKSFLLDTAWWALTGAWPAEVNRRMTSGLPARPRDPKKRSTIWSHLRGVDGTFKSGVGYSREEEAWTPRVFERILGLVVYAHADGSFSVWDTVRNYPERRPPYVFTETEVWDGLRGSVERRMVLSATGCSMIGRAGSRAGTIYRERWRRPCARSHRIGMVATVSNRARPCGCRSMMREIFHRFRRATPVLCLSSTHHRESVGWSLSPTC